MMLPEIVNPGEPDPGQCDDCLRDLMPRLPVVTDQSITGEPVRVIAWLCLVCIVRHAITRALEPAG